MARFIVDVWWDDVNDILPENVEEALDNYGFSSKVIQVPYLEDYD